jgi:hypothetical protein
VGDDFGAARHRGYRLSRHGGGGEAASTQSQSIGTSVTGGMVLVAREASERDGACIAPLKTGGAGLQEIGTYVENL